MAAVFFLFFSNGLWHHVRCVIYLINRSTQPPHPPFFPFTLVSSFSQVQIIHSNCNQQWSIGEDNWGNLSLRQGQGEMLKQGGGGEGEWKGAGGVVRGRWGGGSLNRWGWSGRGWSLRPPSFFHAFCHSSPRPGAFTRSCLVIKISPVDFGSLQVMTGSNNLSWSS